MKTSIHHQTCKQLVAHYTNPLSLFINLQISAGKMEKASLKKRAIKGFITGYDRLWRRVFLGAPARRGRGNAALSAAGNKMTM